MSDLMSSADTAMLDAKMLIIQKEVLTASKDSYNPFHKSKYADLGNYLEVLLPVCNRIGLLINQFVSGSNLVTRIIDPETGQFIRSYYPLTITGKTSQEIGSQITYAKRYSIAGIFMISTEDDDGNKEAKVPEKVTKEDLPWLNIPAKNDADKTNIELLKANVTSGVWTSLAHIRNNFKVSTEVGKLIVSQYPQLA